MSKDSKTELRNSTTINKKHRNEELGDFTTTWRVVPISLLAMVIGCGLRICRSGTAPFDRVIHQSVLFWPVEHGDGFAGR